MENALERLSDWIGRSETVDDIAYPTPVIALTATLDHPRTAAAIGSQLPPLWHWLYFLPMHRQSEIGPDGHAKRGGFLPPVPLPRRMWAGSQFEFRAPIRVGDRMSRTSIIDDVTAKEGRTGKLVFVKVRHELRCNGATEPALIEFHDIVYREAQRPDDVSPPPQKAALDAAWQREIVPDDVLLFRYSALTFNGHRIHYDRDYVTRVEGYPGLIFHGPLQAALIVEFAAKLHGGMPPQKFSYRGVQPLFEGTEFSINANDTYAGTDLWIANAEGQPTMKGTATW